MSSLTPERNEAVEVVAIRLQLAVKDGDMEKVTRIINELDLWTARAIAGSMAWLAFGGK